MSVVSGGSSIPVVGKSSIVGASGPPPSPAFLLLADASSHVLLSDATSKIKLSGT